MWTRDRLEPGTANLVVPWHIPVRHCAQNRHIGGFDSAVPSGRMAGSFPGYGGSLRRGGFTSLEPGLYRGGQLYPGFGIAMDPSDPSTWTRPVAFSEPWTTTRSRSSAVGKAWNPAPKRSG